MNVLIVSPSFGTFGGCEAFVFRLADELTSHEDYRATICFKRVAGEFSLDQTLQEYVDATAARTRFVDRASQALYDEIRDADLVHCQNPSIDVALLAKWTGVPLVMTIHGWLRERWTPRGLAARLARRLTDRRWYNSDFVWSKWEPRRRSASSGKLPIVSDLPTGIVPPGQRRGFVFAARWIENKGLEVLLEAYAEADLNRSEWPLTLLGDGPLRPRIEALIRNREIEGVDVRGFVDQDTRDDVMRHAKWMVTPPHTDEDLGLTPIEARHVGVPCIITRDGGLPEAGGQHALICEPRDVDGLRRRLEEAAAMSPADYAEIGEATRAELMDYLQPMSLYLDHYQAVA
jgi:glycosyltransferase involved in cell wall biosynthesis